MVTNNGEQHGLRTSSKQSSDLCQQKDLVRKLETDSGKKVDVRDGLATRSELEKKAKYRDGDKVTSGHER